MTAYNAERWIGEAVQSILDQTFGDFELLVVNDGSSDRTREILGGFSDQRLRVIDQANQGVVAAANRGLGMITTPLIARMDADDRSYPTRLERQIDFLDSHPQVTLLGSAYRVITEDGRPIMDYRVLQRDFDLRRDTFLRNPFGHSTVVYRTEAVRAAGGYRAEWKVAHDWDLWLRMPGKHANLPEVLIDYRSVEGSVFNSNPDEKRAMLDRIWSEGRPSWPAPHLLLAGAWIERRQLRFYLRQTARVERVRWLRRSW